MNDMLRQKLADLKARQASGEHMVCPRCGLDRMKPELYTNALSREAGADMETVEADPPADAILARCAAGAFSTVILGKGPGAVAVTLTRALGEERVLIL